MSVTEVLGGVLVLATLFAAALFLLKFLYDYKVNSSSIDISLFGFIPIYRIQIIDVEYVEIISRREAASKLGVLRFGNRIIGEGVLIFKRNGVVRRVLVTPRDPHSFISQVELALQRTNTGA